jgi:hypothetical protein
MNSSQQARALANYLAPMLDGAQGVNVKPGSQDDPSRHQKGIIPTGPDVDSAIYLEAHEVLTRVSRRNGTDTTAARCGRLTKVLEGDDHAVGVLWALLAGYDDQLPEAALQLGAAGPSANGSAPRDGKAAGSGKTTPRWTAARSALSRFWANLCMNAIVAGVLFLAWWWAWPPLQLRPQAGALSLEVFAVWSLSFLPGWLYLRFLGQRAGALWDEYVLNLHRLRWSNPRHLPKPPVNSDFYLEWLGDGGPLFAYRSNIYQQKFDAYYGKGVSRSGEAGDPPVRLGNLFPVFLTTAVLAVCWTALLWNPHFTSNPETFWDVLKFGFLGAYSFILQMLVRRFFQSDLRPAAYANALLRLIVVLILVSALYQIMPQDNPRAAAAIAFVIGFFPLAGMQAIQRFAATTLRVIVPSLSPPYPLNQIDGLSVWYEARLLEEGIEDMQSLATANFVDVILHTRVPVGRLVDWVDQAHLYLHMDRIEGTWRERRHAKIGRIPVNPDSQSQQEPTTSQDSSPAGAVTDGDKKAAESKVATVAEGSVSESARAGSKTRTALRQFGIRNATDLIKAFPPDKVDPGLTLAVGSPWQEHLKMVASPGLDEAQLRTLVRVLANEPSLAPVWNWQERGVQRYVQPAPHGRDGLAPERSRARVYLIRDVLQRGSVRARAGKSARNAP